MVNRRGESEGRNEARGRRVAGAGKEVINTHINDNNGNQCFELVAFIRTQFYLLGKLCAGQWRLDYVGNFRQ